MNKNVIHLTRVKGFERLYSTLLKDEQIQPKQYTLLFNWYRAIHISLKHHQHMIRQDFCNCLENTDEKPYASDIQTLRALDTLKENIDMSVFDPVITWAYSAEDRLDGLRETYEYKLYEKYGCEPRSQLTEYFNCEPSLYPRRETPNDIKPSYNLYCQHNNQFQMEYICAPLRGDVEANIEKAKQYAREVFLQGHIPICPHIYFPQFASVDIPQEDRSAMDMGMALLRICSYINVYCDPPTTGMMEEIDAAKRWGIPIRNMTEQEKAKPKRNNQTR